MIFGKLEDIRAQIVPLPQILMAVDYVKHLNFKSIEDGQYKLPETRHEVIIQSFMPAKFPDRIMVEGHIKFIDFYYIINGSEVIGTIPARDLADKTEYNQDLDVWTCDVAREKLSMLKLNQGDAIILFPEDAHAPQLIDREPTMTRKVIIKIEI